MERQGTARAASTRPPSVVPVPRTAMSTASRPITQQGLSGLRPPPTSGAGSSRIYRDKRYYTSRMQSHMNTIREEIAKLNKSTSDYRIASLSRHEMRKTAETTAKKLTEQQELLTVYNTALDMHLSKTRTEEIVAETADLKHRNEMLLKELDTVFQKKVRKEEEIEDLKKRTTEEEQFIKSLIEQLSPESKEKYYALAEENRRTLENIANMQTKIKNSKEMIEKYKVNIQQSIGKQKKLQLLRNFTKLKTQKNELESFVQNTLTPAQQREKLLQQVKKDKADIDSLLKVKTSVEDELQLNETRLSDLEHELDGKDNARLKKHKELRERGEHMEKFIKEYEETSVVVKEKIRNINQDIAIALEYMAENLTEINLKELDFKFDTNEQNTLEGWTNKYKLLSSQISRINSVKQKYENEISTMKEKMGTMKEELELYEDIEKGKAELMDKKSNLSEQEDNLKSTLESTRSAVVESRKKRDDMKQNIESNDDYNEIMKLEKKIEETERENKELEALIEAESNSAEMDDMLAQLDDMLKKRNMQLIEEMRKKSSMRTFD